MMREEEMLDEMEDDEELEDMPELIYPEEGPLTRMLLMGFPSDRIYLVYDCGEQYYFYPIGNEVFGIDPEKIPEAVPTRAQMEENRKARIFDKKKISNCKLSRKRSISTQLDNCGSFHFTYEGKVQKFILLEHPTEEQITTFLSDVSAQFPPKTDAELNRDRKQAEQAAEIQQAGVELSQEQDPDTFRKCKLIGRVLSISSWILIAGTALICDPYELWVGLCMLMFAGAYLLCICKPTYFSVTTFDKREAQAEYGTEMVSLASPFMLSGLALMMRAMVDVNYLSYTKLLIYTVVCVIVLAAILFARSRTARKTISTLFVMLFFLLAGSFGLVGELNYLLDDAVPYDTSKCEITDMYISSSSKSADTYEITVNFRGEELTLSILEEEYDALQIGDSIPVYYYRGGLGIPFADIY